MFDKTGTIITLSGSRSSTEGFYNFDEANNWFNNSSSSKRSAVKNLLQLSLSQNIGDFGSISFSAYQQEYWDNNKAKNRTFMGSWSKSFNGVSVSLNESQTKNWNTGKTDNIFSLNVSLPFGQWLSPNSDFSSMRLSNRYSTSSQHYSGFNSTLSGTALEDNNLSYTVSQSWDQSQDGDTTNNTALFATYSGGQGIANLGYSNYYGENSQINWGLRGSIVAHPHGVTLSQPLFEGGAYAIVRAPGANDVEISNQRGLVTDWRGYAIVPSLVPYRENTVSLNTESLGDNVDLVSSIQRFVPTREAFVLADYNTRIGYRLFLTVTHNGSPLSFGTLVQAGDASGMTDEQGQVYIAGVKEGTTLIATLSDGMTCKIPFDTKKMDIQNGIVMATVTCQ